MDEYELYTEDITPCGGPKYARKELLEIQAESPEAYVKANGRHPILDIEECIDGSTVITTGDGNGYIVRYRFYKCR